MMRFFFNLLFLTSIIFASDGVSFGEKKRVYTIQLFSIMDTYSGIETINKIPLNLRDEIHLHKAKKHIVACYSQASKYSEMQSKLQKVKKAGYKNAYIITTTRWYIPHKADEKKLSKFTISKMISKANKAYRSGDEMQTMMIYEMLLSAGVKNEKIKSNLCYLYGKNGAWTQAKGVIEKEMYQSKLLYAYANGAATTLQKNFYDNLKEYILLDRSGHLALLAGYYFEQKNQMKRALDFYKIAYNKNKSDLYNIYAYARSLDMLGKNQMATPLYKELLLRTKEGSDIYKRVKSRL